MLNKNEATSISTIFVLLQLTLKQCLRHKVQLMHTICIPRDLECHIQLKHLQTKLGQRELPGMTVILIYTSWLREALMRGVLSSSA